MIYGDLYGPEHFSSLNKLKLKLIISTQILFNFFSSSFGSNSLLNINPHGQHKALHLEVTLINIYRVKVCSNWCHFFLYDETAPNSLDLDFFFSTLSLLSLTDRGLSSSSSCPLKLYPSHHHFSCFTSKLTSKLPTSPPPWVLTMAV